MHHEHPDVKHFNEEHQAIEHHLDKVRRGTAEPDPKKARLAHSLAAEARGKAEKLARFAGKQKDDNHLREAVTDVNQLHECAGKLTEAADELDHHLKGREVHKSAGPVVSVLDHSRPDTAMPDGWYIPRLQK